MRRVEPMARRAGRSTGDAVLLRAYTYATGAPANLSGRKETHALAAVTYPSRLQDLFVLSSHHNGTAFSKAEFQPLKHYRARDDSADYLDALETDSFLLGGVGPVPTLSEYLALLSAVKRHVHVVQLGAHAGGSEANEWVQQVLTKNPNWTATVVEPVPWIFELLAANYARRGQRDRVEPLRLAVALQSGPCEMHAVGNQSRVSQISTLALGNQTQGTRCFTSGRPCNFVQKMVDRRELHPITVRCTTLERLLNAERRHPSTPVDVLVMDLEMFDYTLIRNLDLRAPWLRPLAIEFESKTMTMQQGAEVAARLALQGYLCRFAPVDTWEAAHGGARHYSSRHSRFWRGAREKYAEAVCYRML